MKGVANKTAARQLGAIGQRNERRDVQAEYSKLLDYVKAHPDDAKYINRFIENGQLDMLKGIAAPDAGGIEREKPLSKNT